MKKKKAKHHAFDNNEASERLYQQKFKADQRTIQTFFNSFSRFFCVPFYSYDYPIYPQTNSIVEQLEDNKNKKYLKKQKNK